MPKIGYGSNKATKFLLPNGLKKLTISNVKDLEMLLMHNSTHTAEVANNVGAKKRIETVNRARQLDIKLANGHARLVAADSE